MSFVVDHVAFVSYSVPMLNHTEARRHLHGMLAHINNALSALADRRLDQALEEIRDVDRQVLVEIEANLALEVEETEAAGCGLCRDTCPSCEPLDAAEYR